LAPEMIKEFGIEIIPLHVVYKDREYLDGVNISPDEVYNNLYNLSLRLRFLFVLPGWSMLYSRNSKDYPIPIVIEDKRR
jgi:hypothetical protein